METTATTCPMCAEEIEPAATRCPHCGSARNVAAPPLTAISGAATSPQAEGAADRSGQAPVVGSLVSRATRSRRPVIAAALLAGVLLAIGVVLSQLVSERPCRTVNGDLVIAHLSDVDNLGDVCEVKGNFEFSVSIANLALPRLVTVGGNFTLRNDDVKRLAFPALGTVGGDLVVECRSLASLDVTHLAKTNGLIRVSRCGGLASLDLPVLERTKAVIVFTNPTLSNVAAPALVSASDVKIASNQALAAIALPSLKTVWYGLEIANNQILTAISLPQLEQVGNISGHFWIRRNVSLTTLSTPRLRRAMWVEVSGNPALTSCAGVTVGDCAKADVAASVGAVAEVPPPSLVAPSLSVDAGTEPVVLEENGVPAPGAPASVQEPAPMSSDAGPSPVGIGTPLPDRAMHDGGSPEPVAALAPDAVSPPPTNKPTDANIFWVKSQGLTVAKAETTIGQYGVCVGAGACDGVAMPWGNHADEVAIHGVTWQQAAAFCAWVGGRLPTQKEWVRLASNGGTTKFPWAGGDWNDECHHDSPKAGCRCSKDVNADGVCDLGGNVREWVDEGEERWPKPGQVYRGWCGGTASSPWTDPQGGSYCKTSSERDSPNQVTQGVGFRCVAAPNK